MSDSKFCEALNWYGIEYAREYDKLCCIVCGKVFDDTNGMYSWPITHGHPTAAVTVVFGCGGAHSREEFDRAASVQFGWMLTPGEFVKTP